MIYRIKNKERSLKGKIFLGGSKSISNRVLIIEALSGDSFHKENLASANDTVLLQQLLSSSQNVFDAHDAGTVFRFLTALLAFKKGEWVLTGTQRMQQRPVGDLVDALRKLGAQIECLQNENFPPLKISGGKLRGDFVEVNAGISSQFVSALLLIAPCMPSGLTIELKGNVVSEPYIEMTLSLLKYFGVLHSRNGNSIHVKRQAYQPRDIFIESDWSAASYYYEMAAFATEVDLELNGLLQDSFQGDATIARFMKSFGVETIYGEKKIRLKKVKAQPQPAFNLQDYPDLAPAMFVTAGGLSQKTSFTGLEHLAYKESDRENALRTELAKCGIIIRNASGVISVEGNFSAQHPKFYTYKDHRMAMAFAPLCLKCDEVMIDDPMVVNKSYPSYWDDLKSIGFLNEEV